MGDAMQAMGSPMQAASPVTRSNEELLMKVHDRITLQMNCCISSIHIWMSRFVSVNRKTLVSL
jgi:uncharacterized integral membrane protein